MDDTLSAGDRILYRTPLGMLHEATVTEISPAGKLRIKELYGQISWCDTLEIEILEVLPPREDHD